MQTNEAELIDRLAAAVAQHLQPAIPLAVDLWDIKKVAALLKRSEAHVREHMACLPDFPKAIRLPTARAGRSQALYKATEILAWTEKYQDRH